MLAARAPAGSALHASSRGRAAPARQPALLQRQRHRSACAAAAEAAPAAGTQLALHLGDTTLQLPFSPAQARVLDEALTKLLQTFADKQAAKRPKRCVLQAAAGVASRVLSWCCQRLQQQRLHHARTIAAPPQSLCSHARNCAGAPVRLHTCCCRLRCRCCCRSWDMMEVRFSGPEAGEGVELVEVRSAAAVSGLQQLWLGSSSMPRQQQQQQR